MSHGCELQGLPSEAEQVAQLSQTNRAAGCQVWVGGK